MWDRIDHNMSKHLLLQGLTYSNIGILFFHLGAIITTKCDRYYSKTAKWSAEAVSYTHLDVYKRQTFNRLGEFEVQEIIFAIPSMDADKKKALYEYYRSAGYKLKVYDYPTMYAVGGKRHLREFDIEELLFRKPLAVSDEHTNEYYRGKVVLITGGAVSYTHLKYGYGYGYGRYGQNPKE